MDIWDRVFNEVYDAKVSADYISLYMRKAKNKSSIYKGFVILVSAIGSITWVVNEWFSIAACILLFIVQLLEKLEAFIVLDNEKIQKIGEYRLKYCESLNRYDQLLMEMSDNVIDDNTARERYFKLRRKGLDIERIDNTVKIDDDMNLFKQAEKKAKLYMEHHFSKPEGE